MNQESKILKNIQNEIILKKEFKSIKKLISISFFLFMFFFLVLNGIYFIHLAHFNNIKITEAIFNFLNNKNIFNIEIIIFINISIIIFFILIYIYLNHHLNNIFKNIMTQEKLNFKNEKELLGNKIIRTIAENLHHEIKTPLNSLKNIFKKYDLILEIFIRAVNENNFDLIKKIVNGERSFCELCPNKSAQQTSCLYYIYFNKNLEKNLKDLKKAAKSALENMESTINITKSIKSLKKTKNISLYDIIEQTVIILKMLKKYKFDYKIDYEFKQCYLNGLPNEVLINILLNHFKNSLEAQSSFIYVKFIKYKSIDAKKYVKFLIIDNGNGIHEDKLNKIYELNFSTKSDEIRGTGLYLSKQLLNFYGGDEKVIYTSDDGTAFELIIPVRECFLKKD